MAELGTIERAYADGYAAAQAEIARLTAERDRLHSELSTANNAHREMAKQLADMGRERDRLVHLLTPFAEWAKDMDDGSPNSIPINDDENSPTVGDVRRTGKFTFEQSA